MQQYIQLGIEGGLMHDTTSEAPQLSFRIFTFPAREEVLPFDGEKHEYLVKLPSPMAEMKLSVVAIMLGHSPENAVGFVHACVHPVDDLGKRLYFSVLNVAEEAIGEMCVHVNEPTREGRIWATQYPQGAVTDTRGFYTPQPMHKQRGPAHAHREQQFLAARRKDWQRQAIRAAASIAAADEESGEDGYGAAWQPNSRRSRTRPPVKHGDNKNRRGPPPKTRKCQMKVGYLGVGYPQPQDVAYTQTMYKQFMAEERRLKNLAERVNKQHAKLNQRWTKAHQAKANLEQANDVKRDALKYIQTIQQLKAEVLRQQQEIRRLTKYKQFARAKPAKSETTTHSKKRSDISVRKSATLKRKRVTRKGKKTKSSSHRAISDGETGYTGGALHLPVKKAASDVQHTKQVDFAPNDTRKRHDTKDNEKGRIHETNESMDQRLLRLQGQIQSHHAHLERLSTLLPPSSMSQASTPRSDSTATSSNRDGSTQVPTSVDQKSTSNLDLSEVSDLRHKVRMLTNAVHDLKLEMLDNQPNHGGTSSAAGPSNYSSNDHPDHPTDTDDSLM